MTFVPVVSGTLRAGHGSAAGDGHVEDAAAGRMVAYSVTAREGKGPDSDGSSGNLVTVPVKLNQTGANGANVGLGDDPAFTLDQDAGRQAVVTTPTLTAGMGSNAGHPGDAGKDDLVLAVTHALTAEGADASEDGTGRGTPLVPLGFMPRQHGQDVGEDVAPTLAAQPDGGNAAPAVSLAGAGVAVRRLTPMECERLQGYPDGWTDGQSDSARYRQLGNSIAVPVVAWIACRLAAVDQLL